MRVCVREVAAKVAVFVLTNWALFLEVPREVFNRSRGGGGLRFFYATVTCFHWCCTYVVSWAVTLCLFVHVGLFFF